MRAKFVYESVNFERGKDPKGSMRIGDRVAQYEEMMRPWLEKVEEKAKKFGFIDNTAEVKEIWKNHYTDRFSEEDEERDYLIRSWRRKAGRIIGKKRYPTVKLELRELSSYWEEVSHHVRDANEYGVYYIVLSDPNHQVEFPGQAWYGFDTDDDLQRWTTDKHWEELITKSGIYESVNFERGKDPKSSMGLGLVGIVRKELEKLGLTRESTISLLGGGTDPQIGTSYHWDDETWANHAELDTFTNGNTTKLSVYNSEDDYIDVYGPDEIMEYVTSGKLSKFINLE